jgi:ABC-type Zn uptake system ZnuABC Zn-binding protein ZnuA
MPSHRRSCMEHRILALYAAISTRIRGVCILLPILFLPIAGCSPAFASSSATKVTAVENFLADIARNIAGDRIAVQTLIPFGVEPHEFDPSPRDMVTVSESDLLIVNGGGLEGWLDSALRNIGGTRIVVTASAGLPSRTGTGPSSSDIDPHYWLNPLLVKTYAANIRDGLIQVDPDGESEYRRNAGAYADKLDELDRWIESQVGLIPADQRVLVTNHESLGYFADRYGFTILGTILPGVSPDAQPTASQISDLIDAIRSSGAKAIFLETGVNTQIADQIAQETGCQVVTSLYTHSLTPPGGIASTYLEMMRYDVGILVEALR